MDILKKFDGDKEKLDILEDVFKLCRYLDILSILFFVVDIGVIEDDV